MVDVRVCVRPMYSCAGSQACRRTAGGTLEEGHTGAFVDFVVLFYCPTFRPAVLALFFIGPKKTNA